MRLKHLVVAAWQATGYSGDILVQLSVQTAQQAQQRCKTVPWHLLHPRSAAQLIAIGKIMSACALSTFDCLHAHSGMSIQDDLLHVVISHSRIRHDAKKQAETDVGRTQHSHYAMACITVLHLKQTDTVGRYELMLKMMTV